MKSIPRNLSSLLSGELTCAENTREYFSTDGSIFKINPKIIVYPRNEEDVINTVRYLSWEYQEGNKISITSRGKGTDQGGGALGDEMCIRDSHRSAWFGTSSR